MLSRYIGLLNVLLKITRTGPERLCSSTFALNLDIIADAPSAERGAARKAGTHPDPAAKR